MTSLRVDVLFAVALLLGILAALPSDGKAAATVEFLVPTSEVATDPAGSIVTFKSGTLETVSLGGCGAAGAFPVQWITFAVNGLPDSIAVILASSRDAVSRGTRLADVTVVGTCAIDSNQYIRYRGTVQ